MESRRNFLKKGLYVAPVVMTLAVRPAMAGQAYRCEGGKPKPSNPNPCETSHFSFSSFFRGR